MYKEDYDKNTYDLEDFQAQEVNISPSYLIMNSLLKAQTVLANEDAKSGFIKFYILIEYVEKIAKSAKQLPDDYDQELKEELSKIKESDSNLKNAKTALIKLELVTKHVFNNKTLNTPLKL